MKAGHRPEGSSHDTRVRGVCVWSTGSPIFPHKGGRRRSSAPPAHRTPVGCAGISTVAQVTDSVALTEWAALLPLGPSGHAVGAASPPPPRWASVWKEEAGRGADERGLGALHHSSPPGRHQLSALICILFSLPPKIMKLATSFLRWCKTQT